MIFDYTGTYHLVFRLNSGIYLATSVLYSLILLINWKQPSFFWESDPEKQPIIIENSVVNPDHIELEQNGISNKPSG